MVKKIPLRPSCIKKTPPPGPLINSCFLNHQKIRGKIAFSAFRGFCFLAHFSVFSILHLVAAHELSSKIFPLLRGGKKTGENKGFFACFVAVCFWWWYFSMWCPYARVSLDAPSSLQRCDLSLLSYIILNLSFCFPFFFFGGGGGYSSFYINHFNGPAPVTKKQDQNTENPNIWNFCFTCSALGPAPSHFLSPGPQNNRNPKPSTLENRTSLLDHVLNPVLKCLFLQCFSNINQICPQNRPLTKMITLHNAQNKTGCFRNGLLWKMKTFMLTKTHNWKNEKTKLRKGFWKTKQNRKPQKTKIIDEKKPFKCIIFSWNKHKETRQTKTTKKQGRRQSTRKQGKKQKKQETR